MGDYDASIETCTKAVDDGRELRADYKLVAKAFGRIGSAYMKKGDLGQAVTFFNKSLSEHRTPDILNKLRETEKLKKEQERTAYINPELADKAREEGNAQFKVIGNQQWTLGAQYFPIGWRLRRCSQVLYRGHQPRSGGSTWLQ